MQVKERLNLEGKRSHTRRVPKEEQPIDQFMLGHFAINALLDPRHQRQRKQTQRRTRTWNPLNTIFSFRAHVAISLKKTLNVGKPNLVSGRSWFKSLDCMSDGGGATAGSGGSSHIALYSAS